MTLDDATGWREYSKEQYPSVDWYDPFDMPGIRERLSNYDTGIKLDYVSPADPIAMYHWDIEAGILSCDRILLGFPTSNQASFGTGWEAGVAYLAGIPTIAWIPDGTAHPFIRANMPVYQNQDEAISAVVSNDMQPARFESALGAALHVMRQIMLDRQGKYGPSNITRNGVLGLIVRAGDKLARIENDHKHSTLGEAHDIYGYHDETSEDAWLDLANYTGPIHHMLTHGTWGLPLMASLLDADEKQPDSSVGHAQPES